MYKKVDCILTSLSASALTNNLALKTNKSKKQVEAVAVIHQDSVCLSSVKQSSGQNKTKIIRCAKYSSEIILHITQVAWCNIGCETVLIVTSTSGLHVYDHNGEECLFTHPCSDMPDNSSQSFAKGIAVFNTFSFCVGNNVGCIRMFGPPDMSRDMTFLDRKLFHKYPISDLSVHNQMLASVDEQGFISISLLEGEELILAASAPSFSDCVAVKLKKSWLITAYGSGHIRLYTVDTEQVDMKIQIHLSVDITAHARAITGLDLSENGEYLLSVSEDCFAKVWQLSKNDLAIKHVSNVVLRDNMLMGGKFLNANGTLFCVSAYDSNVVTCFSL